MFQDFVHKNKLCLLVWYKTHTVLLENIHMRTTKYHFLLSWYILWQVLNKCF